MAERDLYADLGLKRGATKEEIKKAYRKLARELHPDRNPDNPRAEERFKRVAYANDVLGDERKRALYDEFGEVGLREGFDAAGARAMRSRGRAGAGPQGFGFEEIFSQGAQARGRRSGFGSTLEDLFGGGIDDLFGRGGAPGSGFAGRVAQPNVGGAGGRPPDQESEISVSFGDAMAGAEKELTIREGQRERNIRVRIPAGVSDGGKVRLRGQGAQVAGLDPGDLVLTVRVEEHPLFQRVEDDLHLTLPITIGEAWRGASIKVPTLQGEVSLKIPARVQSGGKLRLKGKGAPKRDGGRGDLLVHLQIRLPTGHDHARIEKAVEELESEYTEDVRAGLKG
jgi:curved DNA-binding protein